MKEKGKSSPAEPPAPAPGAPSAETGWLPDCVYTGEKFEDGLAFFADGSGRITRFSRAPADLAAARRLAGQAALPGLVNGHSQSFQRILRGRMEGRARIDAAAREERERALGRLAGEDAYDVARMAFLEMVLTGITCVGELHPLRPDPGSGPDPGGCEILRAAHDIGIRLALFAAAPAGPAPEPFIAAAEALALAATRNYPAEECWVGLALQSLTAGPLEFVKAAAAHAHARRMRLCLPLSARPEDNAACVAAHGQTPVSLLARHGLLDKRFTAVHAVHLTDEEIRLLGAARAAVCACPTSERQLGLAAAPVAKLLAAGAAVALGSGRQVQIDLLEDARLLEYSLRREEPGRSLLQASAAPLLHAATVAGARSLGATGGAIEIGRPADFFTVSLHDPSIAGADPGALLENIVFSLERRAVREVWIGARQRIVNGRHPLHGAIIGRFADLQRRLWS